MSTLFCKYGHELVGNNVIARSNGRKGCRACKHLAWHRMSTARKAARWESMCAAIAHLPCPEGARLIPLFGKRGKGKAAIVDAELFDALRVHKWHLSGPESAWYAARKRTLADDFGGTSIRLHHVVLPPTAGMVIDHINRDPLDCRRANLRVATRRQNMMNTKRRKDSTTGHKGVTWDAARQKYTARVKVDGKAIFLGRFNNLEEAASAYNNAATKHYGQFACLDPLGEG